MAFFLTRPGDASQYPRRLLAAPELLRRQTRARAVPHRALTVFRIRLMPPSLLNAENQPACAHASATMLPNGCVHFERIKASACDSSEKAKTSAERLITVRDKLRLPN